MSDSHSKPHIHSDQEQYAYAITRKLFKFTIVGTVLFAGAVIAIWYVF